jgi:hypothetical protein
LNWHNEECFPATGRPGGRVGSFKRPFALYLRKLKNTFGVVVSPVYSDFNHQTKSESSRELVKPASKVAGG